MTNNPVIIIGNGGHASVLTEILVATNREILGFTALSEEENQFGLRYLGLDQCILNFEPNSIELVLGIGTVNVSNIRANIFSFFKNKGYKFANVVHPSTIISPSVKLGEGVQIMAGTVLQTNVSIADNTIVNTSSLLDHDCFICEHVHIAPGCMLSGSVYVGKGSHIGTGTTVIQGIKIGDYCLVGAGSVVLGSLNDYQKAYGVPAKEVK